jgi:hypothetical protein
MKNPKVFISLVTNLEFMNWDWKKIKSKGYVTNGAILQFVYNLISPDLYPFHPCLLVNSVREQAERNCERDLSTER